MGLIKGPKDSGKTVKISDTTRNLYSEFDGEVKIFSNVPFKGIPMEELQKAERLGEEGEIHPWQTEENDLAGTLDNARFAVVLRPFYFHRGSDTLIRLKIVTMTEFDVSGGN